MKILIILISNEMNKILIPNILNLKKYLDKLTDDMNIIDYAGISSYNDFSNYENIISFKYKLVCQEKQINKLCKFITENKLNYDWYIKIRPEVYLIDEIDFNKLEHSAINGRARKYIGSKKIKYGLSVGGKGQWSHIKDVKYNEDSEFIELDDQIFIFDQYVINSGGFLYDNLFDIVIQNETTQTNLWNKKNIKLNIIGINMRLDYCNGKFAYSGDIDYC